MLHKLARLLRERLVPGRYRRRLANELSRYAQAGQVHDLPPIFHYWSDTYVRPLIEAVGASNPDAFLARHLHLAARRTLAPRPRFLSLGAGNCDTEVRVAEQLRAGGLTTFQIECLDVNRQMLARGQQLATAHGVAEHLVCRVGDFNRWQPDGVYDGIMANQSLHHVSRLEHLFDGVRRALKPGADFVVSDMIGRNGHQRWPEALGEVQHFWQELPPSYRWNHQLGRHEDVYQNWDCSHKGFEGIRAQDILPELLRRFHFPVFIGFGNIIDVFVDRGFGPNFAIDRAWDRQFVDRVHARDEELLRAGTLTPTHMLAVLSVEPRAVELHSRGIAPPRCVRLPRA